MNPFSRQRSAQPPPTDSQPCDDILGDLPRGEEGRRRGDSTLPRTYFESPENLAALGFTDRSADNFLGVIGGVTDLIMRNDGREEYRTRGGVPVGVRDDRHRLTQAGNRAGKGRSVIIPDLLSYGAKFGINVK
ncbi:MAG: hypothetical protein ACREF9_13865, partial [Opitutaceae bacterium]